MIPVQRADPPDTFDAEVRDLGLCALAEFIGQPQTIKRSGPKRQQLVVNGVPITRVEEIPPDKLPALWTEALNDMLERYGRVCAYVCIYIERVTGSGSIDHWIPKSVDPRLAYEWSNYRLACSMMNARKGVHTDLVDPFEVEDGWFELELLTFDVLPCPTLPLALLSRVDRTIKEFNLNCLECRTLREHYVTDYLDGIPLWHLERRAPFIARELRRQGRLRAET
jgi:hypothetical protein